MEQVGKVEQAMFHLFPEKHPIYRGFTQKTEQRNNYFLIVQKKKEIEEISGRTHVYSRA